MPRWYAVFSGRGSTRTVLDQIARKVQLDRLGPLVPLVRFERGAGRGQFYFALAVEGPAFGELPDGLTGLLHLGCLSGPIREAGRLRPFQLDELASLVSREVAVDEYARRIPYQPPDRAVAPPPDPFAEAAEAPVDAEAAVAAERLLLWVSAIGSGSWPLLAGAARTLGIAEPGQLLRPCRLLGHLETTPDGQRWAVAPPVLVRAEPPGQPPSYHLCGQRDGPLLLALERAAAVERIPQPAGAGPAALRLPAAAVPTLRVNLEHLGCRLVPALVPDAPQRLAALLPPLDAWPRLLRCLEGIHPAQYRVERLSGERFVPAAFTGDTGLYRLWPEAIGPNQGGTAARPAYTLFYDAPADAWLGGDLSGLRCLARYLAGERATVRYDPATARLAVPPFWRPPELYERALVLASGLLPARRDGWLVYEAIPRPLLARLAEQLDLTVEEA